MSQDCEFGYGVAEQASSAVPPISTRSRSLHRIAEVRRREGISIRSVARNLGLRLDEARIQEEPETDLSLSQLVRWKDALEVPLADLIVDNGDRLSKPVKARAGLIRIMKTVRSIEALSSNSPVQKLAESLKAQLLQLMPELENVAAWPLVGQRRAPNEMGPIAERVFPVTFARDSMH